MAVEQEEKIKTEGFSKKVRIVFASIALAFCFVLIGYIVLKGSPTNSLHESALAWAFVVTGGTLAGIGFGAIASLLPTLVKTK
jgi:cytochrome bd-type quinol oxidase subunit 2